MQRKEYRASEWVQAGAFRASMDCCPIKQALKNRLHPNEPTDGYRPVKLQAIQNLNEPPPLKSPSMFEGVAKLTRTYQREEEINRTAILKVRVIYHTSPLDYEATKTSTVTVVGTVCIQYSKLWVNLVERD